MVSIVSLHHILSVVPDSRFPFERVDRVYLFIYFLLSLSLSIYLCVCVGVGAQINWEINVLENIFTSCFYVYLYIHGGHVCAMKVYVWSSEGSVRELVLSF